MKRPWRYHLSRLWFPFISIFLLLYFVYHFIQGNHGYRAKKMLETQLMNAQNILDKKNRIKEDMERRVYLLSPKHLDLDLLEERSRAMLNYVEPGEVVVVYEDKKP